MVKDIWEHNGLKGTPLLTKYLWSSVSDDVAYQPCQKYQFFNCENSLSYKGKYLTLYF